MSKDTQKIWKAVECKCELDCQSWIIEGLLQTDGRFQKEDAFIIASAPELLEACKEAFKHFQGKQAKPPVIYDIYTKLGQAIAKAQGDPNV